MAFPRNKKSTYRVEWRPVEHPKDFRRFIYCSLVIGKDSGGTWHTNFVEKINMIIQKAAQNLEGLLIRLYEGNSYNKIEIQL